MEQQPVVIVIGGPNGAGKSTCASRFLPHSFEVRQFVNADVIASGLAGFAPETVAIQAGRIMLDRLDDLAQQRQDFAFETTLSARTFIRFLRRLQQEGYRVQIFYVWLRNPQLAVQRVAARVRRGGHHVPAEVVERRYWRGLRNFLRAYRPLADSWVLCDNSSGDLLVVARGERGQAPEVFDQAIYDEIQRGDIEERREELAE